MEMYIWKYGEDQYIGDNHSINKKFNCEELVNHDEFINELNVGEYRYIWIYDNDIKAYYYDNTNIKIEMTDELRIIIDNLSIEIINK